MKVAKGHFVRIHCELRVKDGDVIESSDKTGPVEYKHGDGKMLAGLEAKITGMDVGEEISGVLPAAEAFGTEESQPSMAIPRESFPSDAKLEVGARFEAKGPQGTKLVLQVLEVTDETITARAVHALAGKELEYRVKVLSVRPPPPPVPKSLSDELVEDSEG